MTDHGQSQNGEVSAAVVLGAKLMATLDREGASRPEAVTALLVAASTILTRDFGPLEAARMMRGMIDEATSQWKQQNIN